MMQALRRPTWPHLGRAQILFEKAWHRHPLGLAICISLVIHLIFLSFRWGLGEIHSRRLNTPLSVVLVNAASHAKATEASKLAQVDLQGSGSSADQDATALHRARSGSEARLEVLEKQQKQILAKLEAERLKSGGQKSGEAQRALPQLNSLEAELSKRLQTEGRGMRHKVMTSTSTKSVVFAQYYDAMRQKIEAYGSTFFPRANGHPLYGSLVIVVSVDSQGRIINNPQGKDGLSIGRSSGNPELDRQALAIVRASAPFGIFPEPMQKQIDVLDLIATFDFARDGTDRLELRH